jgi:hypothetical protein
VQRCQGAGCSDFATVAMSFSPSYSDVALQPSTSYSYRVAASDAAGNISAYSAVASATTGTAVGPAGLVAGYNFDAGSGTTAADISGSGNTGTLNGATWVSGKYGGGLMFNGSATVSVPSSSSLNVTSGITLCAWIQPTANQSGWRTIMQKQTDAFFLNASNSTGALRPSGGATVNGNTVWLTGTTANPLNAWTHVCMTYDGSNERLYVNGALAATQAASGLIQTTSSPLWIGGNSPYGEYFIGVIDEARIYNRALSPAEIQTVMGTPLS